MITFDIPGSARLEIEHFVSDFSGTLSEDDTLIPGIREKLIALAEKIDVHVLSSDTFGKARKELEGIQCTVHILDGPDHTGKKERYVMSLGAGRVAALDNGNNDSTMLKTAVLGVAVYLKEGCSVEALRAAHILVHSPVDAIETKTNHSDIEAIIRLCVHAGEEFIPVALPRPAEISKIAII